MMSFAICTFGYWFGRFNIICGDDWNEDLYNNTGAAIVKYDKSEDMTLLIFYEIIFIFHN